MLKTKDSATFTWMEYRLYGKWRRTCYGNNGYDKTSLGEILPTSFDIGGSSNPVKVVEAMKLLLQDEKVKVVLINIFGGITRCDDVPSVLFRHSIRLRVIYLSLSGSQEPMSISDVIFYATIAVFR